MRRMKLEFEIGQYLRSSGWRLATAESCTGGLVGHRLTNVPGSSDYYLGGVIAYANQVKMEQLGVRIETLQQYGAVSQETVLEMANGVRQRFQADVGLSVSGIAGPSGGTPDKPVGLVWIGLSASGGAQAWNFLFHGTRLQVKQQSAEKALELLVGHLQSGEFHS
jgi:PncC family amidohydrolase